MQCHIRLRSLALLTRLIGMYVLTLSLTDIIRHPSLRLLTFVGTHVVHNQFNNTATIVKNELEAARSRLYQQEI